jgi:hypothetical protein
MATDIEIRIMNNKIDIKPSGPEVPTGHQIRFFTNHPSAEFEVVFHNPENYFSAEPRICSFLIKAGQDKTLTIQVPNNNISLKYYSVCQVINFGIPQPIPPDAPPRIIRVT